MPGKGRHDRTHQPATKRIEGINGSAVRVVDPETGLHYVILRAEVFERMQRLLFDDGDWTPEEQLRFLADSGKQAGWDDPAMDCYDNYDESRESYAA